MTEATKIKDMSPGDSGWCAPEALYAIMDGTGDIVFMLRGDYDLKAQDADLGPQGGGAWLRVSKNREVDEISGINPHTKQRISLGGMVVDAGQQDEHPCYSEEHVREGDIVVDSLQNGGELVWKE